MARLAGLAGVVALLGAGCGVSGGSGTGIEALVLPAGAGGRYLQEAAEQTADVTSQRVSVEVVLRGTDGEELVRTTGEGAFDEETGVGQLATETSGAGFTGADLSMDVVYDGTDAYLRSGLFEMFTGGKAWVKVPGDELEGVAGDLGTGIAADPTSFVELLEATSGPLEDLGTEAVRGVTTRHVAGELDLEALVEEVAPDEADEYRDLIAELPAVADDLAAIPVEAWIDAEGFVRRFTVTIDGAGRDELGGEGISATQTIELWDFDEPVDIDVPSPDEVHTFDVSSLLGD